ncbi:uncharacterized protein AB675_9262 [Cyphellophora attinorum]|uniref:Sugar phosphate phosphatase n=1 Tax=Cyphellophora attinorum TaxID=1664694 RepID=A0A0N0NNI2_9EURO|nr:uncharacterized protein AB675_9262 [Phialophora attinorum]KPI41558.1 hypothetical protein AB675_9262 [Phialophora attinorum]
MDLDPPVPKCMTGDPKSFAYPSVRTRWPAIITSAIDDLHRTISSLHDSTAGNNDTLPAKIAEGKEILSSLASLKYELQHNRILTPLPDEPATAPSYADVKLYNDELQLRASQQPNKELRWHDVEWLFSECYLYRRMYSYFAISTHWKDYDVFRRSKVSTFRSSRPAVLELASRYREIVGKIRGSSKNAPVEDQEAQTDDTAIKEAEKVLFIEMAEICLWGNATDLSLLTSLSYEDIQKLQGSKARQGREEKVLVNDLEKAFDVLWTAKKSGEMQRRVDFVLDNAGFELFVDLVLAGYLLETGLATEVVMHPKSLPWFVSDVVPKDFQELLSVMADPKAFYETPTEEDEGKDIVPLAAQEEEDVKFLFEHWASLHADGQLILRPNRFWTHPGSFWRLPTVVPELKEDLSEAQLVVFKGDLNYRKLIGDANWDPTTPFQEALGPLASNLRILALRTCKGDVVVGLPPGKDEELRAMPGGGGDSGAREWAFNGKWAVVQFSDGKAK